MDNYKGAWRMSPRRSHRKSVLLNCGMLKFEQECYSKLPLSIPYFVKLRKDRTKLFQRAQKEGWTLDMYKKMVMWEYETRGINTQAPGKAEAYAMLRAFEEEWRRVADPNDPYLLKQRRKHHGGFEALNRPKVLEDKRRYNAHPDIKAKRAKYRLEHREQILNAERQRRAFKRNQGTAQ